MWVVEFIIGVVIAVGIGYYSGLELYRILEET